MTTELYRTSPIKRERRTKDDINGLSLRLYELLYADHPMTVRQVFYQMTSRGYIPKTEAAYKGTVCRLLADLRLNGTIPFGWIADNTRWMRKPTTYSNAEQMLQNNQEFYRRAVWADQPVYVEIWIEKDALAGVVYDITSEWDVPLMVTRGYPSLSYTYEAAAAIKTKHKPVYIYYMGDYDPSGLDISRTVEARLREFAPEAEIHFDRIAVTSRQIELWNLPTRPTKHQDTRAAKFGDADSVELDSIPSKDLRDLVSLCIIKHLDSEIFLNMQQVERMERESMEAVYGNLKIKEDGSFTITNTFKNMLLESRPIN
jgi:hypothetical protein